MPTRLNRLAAPTPQPSEPLDLSRPRRQALPVPAHRRRKLAGRSALAVLLFLAVVTGSLAGLTLVYSVDLPQINDLERYRPSTTTDLYDRKGQKIGSFALEHRDIVAYDDFAPILRQAVISIEDKSFESHWGINVFRVIGSAWHDIRSHGRTQGASTLTMQLSKILFLSSERTAARKSSKPTSPSKSSAPSPNSKSSPSTETRSTSATASMASRPPRSISSPSTPKTSPSPKPLSSPACPKALPPFPRSFIPTRPSAAATS